MARIARKGESMRNMSFSMTKRQVRERTKFVTRRLGWENLKPGERVMAIEKGQGLKKGERVERLCIIECVGKRRESLNAITREECALEGFPDMSPDEFVGMFCKANGCTKKTVVSRIEFRYVDGEAGNVLR